MSEQTIAAMAQSALSEYWQFLERLRRGSADSPTPAEPQTVQDFRRGLVVVSRGAA